MAGDRKKKSAGGKKVALSIIIESANQKLVHDVSAAIAQRLGKNNRRVLLEKDFQNPEERTLHSNLRLLDNAGAPLSDSTISLLSVIKLHERLKKIRAAKSAGYDAITNVSWLTEATYYEISGRHSVAQQIITDCGFMRPDVWVVLDEPKGNYEAVAKRAGVRVYSSKQDVDKLVEIIMEHINEAEKSLRTKKPASAKLELGEIPKAELPEVSTENLELSQLAADILASGLTNTARPGGYHKPSHFGEKVLGAYVTIMDKLMENHQAIVDKLAAYLKEQKHPDPRRQAAKLAEPLLPLAANVSVSSIAAMKPEMSPRAHRLQELSKRLRPEDKHDFSFVKSDILPDMLDDDVSVGAELVSFSPRNETEALEGVFYAHINLDQRRLRDHFAGLPLNRKADAFATIPVTAMTHATYAWDIVTDYRTYRALLNLLPTGKLHRQDITPRYGYDIPDLFEKAGVADIAQQSYDLSLELHSLLNAAGFETDAEYAALQGHRVRYKAIVTPADMAKLFSEDNRSKPYRDLIADMRSALMETHPLTVTAIDKH